MNEENYQGEQIIKEENDHYSRTIPGIKMSRGWRILFAVLLVLFLLSVSIIWKMSHKIDLIQLQLDQYQQMVTNQLSSFNGRIADIPYSIDESLKKAESIVADYGYKVQTEQIDRKSRTVPIELTVRPKEDKSGMRAIFLIETEDGKTLTVLGEKGEANTYIASATVPMKDYLKLSVTFDDGITQKSEKLEELYQPFDSMIMKVDSIASWSGLSQINDEIRYSGTIDTTITQSVDNKNYPVKAIIQVIKNGKLKKTIPVEIESAPDTSTKMPEESIAVAEMIGGTSTTYYTQFNETFKLNQGDVLEIKVVVEDNYGFRYTQVVDGETIDKNGGFNSMNYSGQVIIE